MNSHISGRKAPSLIRRYGGTFLLALFFLICTYLFCVYDSTFVSDATVLRWVKVAQNAFSEQNTEVPDDVMLINTCYDRALVSAKDSEGLPCGNIDITDRQKLLRLMQILKKHNNYKYVILDVGLSTAHQTPYDDSLFLIIESMERIALVMPDDEKTDTRLKAKCHDSFYNTSRFSSDCLKAPLVDSSGRSCLMLHAFTELTGKKLSHIGPVYYSEGHLARPIIYPHYSVVFDNQINDSYDASSFNFINLGSNVLKEYSPEEYAELFQDMTIIVGDFNLHDKHMTYAGQLAGPLISLNILLSLYDNAHLIPYWLLTILFIIFLIISDNMLHRPYAASINETQKILSTKKKLSKGLVPLILLSSLYSFVLTALCVIIYLLAGQAYDIMFTGILIGVSHWIIRLINRHKNKNKNKNKDNAPHHQ